MEQLLSSPAYRKHCDLVGRLVMEYGKEKDKQAAQSFRYRSVQYGSMAHTVVASLKRLDFSALLEPLLLNVLCDLTQGNHHLAGFRQLFLGLKTIIQYSHEEVENW